jgi:hypothetical protein
MGRWGIVLSYNREQVVYSNCYVWDHANVEKDERYICNYYFYYYE